MMNRTEGNFHACFARNPDHYYNRIKLFNNIKLPMEVKVTVCSKMPIQGLKDLVVMLEYNNGLDVDFFSQNQLENTMGKYFGTDHDIDDTLRMRWNKFQTIEHDFFTPNFLKDLLENINKEIDNCNKKLAMPPVKEKTELEKLEDRLVVLNEQQTKWEDSVKAREYELKHSKKWVKGTEDEIERVKLKINELKDPKFKLGAVYTRSGSTNLYVWTLECGDSLDDFNLFLFNITKSRYVNSAPMTVTGKPEHVRQSQFDYFFPNATWTEAKLTK